MSRIIDYYTNIFAREIFEGWKSKNFALQKYATIRYLLYIFVYCTMPLAPTCTFVIIEFIFGNQIWNFYFMVESL